MDQGRIGALLAQLRREKGLTQRQVAQQLGVSPKTVSKWECGAGSPDLTYWPALSQLYGVQLAQLMDGEIRAKRPDSGNLNRIRFFVCPVCGNVLFATSQADVFCCGRVCQALTASAGPEQSSMRVEAMDGEYDVQLDHPMEKGHYLSFAAYVCSDQVLFRRLYPEQEPRLRLPLRRDGKLYIHCVRHGLMVYTGLLG